MAVLNDADTIRLGANRVDAAHLGAKRMWPPWTPLELPGLAAWIDPLQDSFTDGQQIASYTSHDPLHRVFTAPANMGPTFRANSIGGKPRLEFQASGMNTLADLGTEGFTFVFVSRAHIPPDYQIMWAYNYVADVTYNAYELRYPANSLAVQIVIEYTETGTVRSTSFAQQADTDYVTMLRADQTNGQINLYINDVEQSDVAVTGVPKLLPTVSTDLAIGMRGEWGWYSGLVAEALVLSKPISPTDRAELMSYLRAKHGPMPPVTTVREGDDAA